MIGRVANLFRVPDIRRRIWYTLFFLAVYRVGAAVPIPGVDIELFKQILQSRDSGSSVIVMFNMLSGGSAAAATLFSLGIMPYISASIIFSLLVKVVPRLEAIAKEGSAGQRRINQWTRWATVPLAAFQAIIFVANFYTVPGTVAGSTTPLISGFGGATMAVLAMTAGTVLLMWIGEQITEHGVGNGISLLIMGGIIARLPYSVHQLMTQNPSPATPVLLIGLFFLVVVVVVYITKGTRRIPVQYAKLMRGRRMYGGTRHFLPLKVNQAGVMPVIFSSALLAFPAMIGEWLKWPWLLSITQTGSWWYTVLDVALIFFFAYFWTSLMFNPAEMSKNMKEMGSFVPGIRPGRPTAEFLERVMIHMTLAGATFLSVIAIVPGWLARQANADYNISGFLGGTSILIVVSVALELVDKLNSHLSLHGYETFLKGGSSSGPRK
jgi:preprotein translocase subunit SecY